MGVGGGSNGEFALLIALDPKSMQTVLQLNEGT